MCMNIFIYLCMYNYTYIYIYIHAVDDTRTMCDTPAVLNIYTRRVSIHAV